MKRLPVVSTVAGLIAAAVSLIVAPEPERLGAARDGDPVLADRVEAVLGDDIRGYRGLSVALSGDGRTPTAMLGDSRGGPLFEIGSITKTLTGMLFADLVADGTVRPDETLGAVLRTVDFRHDDTASITLEELATHRSGLPRLAPGMLPLIRGSLAQMVGANPYAGQDVDALLRAAAGASTGDGRGKVGYSNFGMALLGQALAAKAGKPYPELVSERILRPLGMSETFVALPDPAPAGLATGSSASGHARAAWSSSGYAPAGTGSRSTAADLMRLATATQAGVAPGAGAATPRFAADDNEGIGYAWFTQRYGGREITWHNGGTGGFRSYVAFDRVSGQSVVVLGNTDRAVDWIGLRLLGVTPPGDFGWRGAVRPSVTVMLLFFAAISLPLQALAARGGAGRMRRSLPDRLRAADSLLATVALLLIAHHIGSWLTVPWLLWPLAIAAATAGATALILRWHDLPTRARGSARARWSEFAISAAISTAFIAAFVI